MQMKNTAYKIASLIICAAIATSFSGCLRNIDVSRLVEEPTPYKPPEIEASENKLYPEETDDAYKGAYMDVTPVFGERVRIRGLEHVIQMIIEAYNNPDRLVDEEPSKRGYKNHIRIYNRQDQVLGDFDISSDFLLYARADKDSPLFLLPEYAYYTLEYALWQVDEGGASLVEQLETWERIKPMGDERATYKTDVLELRLAHDIKTVLVQKYGMSEAYFINYEIYTTAEYASSEVLNVRVYALLGYAGYSMMEEEKTAEEKEAETEETEPKIIFAPNFDIVTPARIIYTFVDGKYYRMTEYREPAEYDENYPSTEESRIRAIFPYEYMKEMMAALDNTSNIDLDIRRQALDYLRISGQGDTEIKD